MDGEMLRIFGPALEVPKAPAEVSPQDNPNQPSIPDSSAVIDGDKTNKSDTVPMTMLANFVMSNFMVNADHRRKSDSSGRTMESRLVDAISAQTCSFTADQVSKLISCGVSPKVFSPIIATKIRAASSMLTSIMSYGSDAMAKLEPSPDPDAPKEVDKEAVASVESELAKVFSQLEQSGVEELSPQDFLLLQTAVKRASEATVDAVSNSKSADARMRCKRLERKVNDIMKEGRFDEAFHQFKNYICTYGTGVIAFTLKNVSRNVAVYDKNSDVRKIIRKVVTIPIYEAINPVDCYPAPNAVNIEDGVLCIRMRYQANELHRYASTMKRNDIKFASEGWRANAVSEVLARHPEGGVHINVEPRNADIRIAEKNGVEDYKDCTFEGVRCFAVVKGEMLHEMGITETILGKRVKREEYYRVECVVIDNTVVYCRIYDDRMGVPLAKGTFYDVPGSWWGESIADKLSCCQNVVNNAIKSLMQNMQIASTPMFWMNDLSRFQDRSASGLQVKGGKLWTFSNGTGYSAYGQTNASSVPMGVLSVPSNTSELLSVFNSMVKQADLDSGIAAWSEGTGGTSSGALRTAAGLKTFMESQNRGMQDVVNRIDTHLIRPLYRMTADWVMLYGDDVTLRGDVEVIPIGLMGRILSAQREQDRLQMFSMVLNSQLLQQIAGIKGIVELWRPSLRDLDVNPDNICPSEERIKYLESLQSIRQMFEAATAKQAVQQQEVASAGAGAPPGVEQPPSPNPPGGVRERRAVA